jgi:hypothetical protein
MASFSFIFFTVGAHTKKEREKERKRGHLILLWQYLINSSQPENCFGDFGDCRRGRSANHKTFFFNVISL